MATDDAHIFIIYIFIVYIFIVYIYIYYIYIYLLYIYIYVVQIRYTVWYTTHGSKCHILAYQNIPALVDIQIHTVDRRPDRPNPVQYQLKGDSSHNLNCFTDPGWCRILSIESVDLSFNMLPSLHRCFTIEIFIYIYIYIGICMHYHNRRKFRSETADNMDG